MPITHTFSESNPCLGEEQLGGMGSAILHPGEQIKNNEHKDSLMCNRINKMTTGQWIDTHTLTILTHHLHAQVNNCVFYM